VTRVHRCGLSTARPRFPIAENEAESAEKTHCESGLLQSCAPAKTVASVHIRAS
jgi:hypothetical protein